VNESNSNNFVFSMPLQHRAAAARCGPKPPPCAMVPLARPRAVATRHGRCSPRPRAAGAAPYSPQPLALSALRRRRTAIAHRGHFLPLVRPAAAGRAPPCSAAPAGWQSHQPLKEEGEEKEEDKGSKEERRGLERSRDERERERQVVGGVRGKRKKSQLSFSPGACLNPGQSGTNMPILVWVGGCNWN
jgi:hypothetical protein